jgi:hypothetical protein
MLDVRIWAEVVDMYRHLLRMFLAVGCGERRGFDGAGLDWRWLEQHGAPTVAKTSTVSEKIHGSQMERNGSF